MRPTLDVIIPCYNSAATLQAAVESAVSQPAVENVWLIDDASFDDTRLIMSDLAAIHSKVRCEYMLENGGAAKARNCCTCIIGSNRICERGTLRSAE